MTLWHAVSLEETVEATEMVFMESIHQVPSLRSYGGETRRTSHMVIEVTKATLALKDLLPVGKVKRALEHRRQDHKSDFR